MSQPVHEPVLNTPAVWLELTEPNLVIVDPDGWRYNDGVSYDDPITLEDFQARLSMCTIMTYPHTGGAAPQWASDARSVEMAYVTTRTTFALMNEGIATREEFTALRDAYRQQRETYMSRWVNTPEAIAHFESRAPRQAPTGWDD